MPERGSHEGAPKKATLTLAQLASYDDLITDILVDRVYFWSMIRKNRARYSACRGMKEEEIPNILRTHIVERNNCEEACDKLLKLNGIRKAYERLRSSDEREHFRDHLMRYLESFKTDCPWEVATTNRYTIETQEASVCAKRFIPRGQPVKYLVGIQVPITREEEKALDLTRRDFSIVKSSRKKTSSLFLGPARFANHDCDANARLSTKGLSGMVVLATKDINVGDEITVTYGDQFFGPDNCECLCATCERLVRNGWNPDYARDDESDSSDVESERGRSASQSATNSRSQSRASNSHTGGSIRSTPSQSQTPSPTKKRRLDGSASPTKKSARDRLERVKMERTPSALSHEVRPEEIPDANARPAAAAAAAGAKNGQHSSPSSADGSQYSTEATSWSDREREGRAQASRVENATVLEAASARLLNGDSVGRAVGRSLSDPVNLSAFPSLSRRDSETERSLPELTIEYATSEVSAEGPAGSPERDYLKAKDNNGNASALGSPHEQGRRPGDYSLTRRLLCQPGARWVECRVCDCLFVQHDATQTRQQCPRCERHAKIYGFRWPKTEKAHKNDPDERIKDHREIHPYVFADEERQIRKGRSSHLLELIQEKGSNASTPQQDDSEDADGARPRRHASKRRIDYYHHQQPVEEGWETDHEPPVPPVTSEAKKPKRKDADRQHTKTLKISSKRAYTRTGFWTREAKQQRKIEREERRRRKELAGPRANGRGRPKVIRPRLRPDGTPKRAYNKSGKYIGRAAKRLEQKAWQLASSDGDHVKLPENQRAATRVQELAEQYRQSGISLVHGKRQYIRSGKYSKKPQIPSRSRMTASNASVPPGPLDPAATDQKPTKTPQDLAVVDQNGKKYIKTKWKGWSYEIDENPKADSSMNVDITEERRTRSGRIVSQSADPSERNPASMDTDDSEEDWEDEPEEEPAPQLLQRSARKLMRHRHSSAFESEDEDDLYDIKDSEDESVEESEDGEEEKVEDRQSRDRGFVGTPLRTGRIPRQTAKARGYAADSIEDSDEEPKPSPGRRRQARPVRRWTVASDNEDEPKSAGAPSKRAVKEDTADIEGSQVDGEPGRRRVGRPRKDSAVTPAQKASPASQAHTLRRSKRGRETTHDENDDGPAKMTRSSFRKSAGEQSRRDDSKGPAKKILKTKWKGWVYEMSDSEPTADPMDVDSAVPDDASRTVAASSATQLQIDASSTSSRASSTRRQQGRPSPTELGQSAAASEVMDSNYVTSARATPLESGGFDRAEESPRSTPRPGSVGEDEAPGQRSPGKLRRPSKWRNSLGPSVEARPMLKRPSFGGVLGSTSSSINGAKASSMPTRRSMPGFTQRRFITGDDSE